MFFNFAAQWQFAKFRTNNHAKITCIQYVVRINLIKLLTQPNNTVKDFANFERPFDLRNQILTKLNANDNNFLIREI